MKMLKIVLIAAGMVAISASAQDAAPAAPAVVPPVAPVHTNGALNAMTSHSEMRAPRPGQNDFLKSLDINAEEFKKLPPMEQRAKVKEAVAKKLPELEKQKADGTLSEQDQRFLVRLQMMQRNLTNHPPIKPMTAPVQPAAPAPQP